MDEKPVIVRVTRNVTQPLLDAFLLEIHEREGRYRELVLLRHLETVTDSGTPVDTINSFLLQSDHHKPKDHKKMVTTENAQFEQVFRFEDGNREVYDKFRFFEVFRVETPAKSMISSTSLSPEEKMMAKYLPLLQKYVPKAAQEIERDGTVHSSTSDDSKEDEYVYDYYAADEMYLSSRNWLPLVKVVDKEDLYVPCYESEYRSLDSNTEDYCINSFLDMRRVVSLMNLKTRMRLQ